MKLRKKFEAGPSCSPWSVVIPGWMLGRGVCGFIPPGEVRLLSVASCSHGHSSTACRPTREAVAAEAGLQDASPACFTLKYVDDDGDEVTLSSDEGLADAVRLAAACEWKALKICLSRPGAGTTASAQIRPDSTKVTRRAGMSGSTAGIAAAVLAVLGIGGFMALRGSATTFDDVPTKQR